MIGIAVAGLCAVVWFGDPTTPGGYLPVCPLKHLLDVDCPGCGGLRMLYQLLHGNLRAAIHFNALALAGIGLAGYEYLGWIYQTATGRRVRKWYREPWASRITLAALVGWAVVRNIPLAAFTGLHV